MKKSKQKKLIIRIVKKIEEIYNQHEQIIKKYEYIEKKQKNQEFWIKATRYLAFLFIIVRITYFCYNNLL